MTDTAIPGYRRRIRIAPEPGQVVASLEDDFHFMRVTVQHLHGVVTAIVPEVLRSPWSTCPGAIAKLVETFQGALLTEVTARQDKKRNCTHLHDLAVLGAAHANDAGETLYDIAADDPVDGEITQRVSRNGELLFTWREHNGVLVAPEEIAGLTLFTLRDWIGSLPEPKREAARLLQWASIVAHGRTIPSERRLTAEQMPPNCYTFQPEQAAHAHRLDTSRDFSLGVAEPLDGAG